MSSSTPSTTISFDFFWGSKYINDIDDDDIELPMIPALTALPTSSTKHQMKRSSSFDKMKQIFSKKNKKKNKIDLKKRTKSSPTKSSNNNNTHLSVPQSATITNNNINKKRLSMNKVTKIVEWFEKIKDNKALTIDVNYNINKIKSNKMKSWRPSLNHIFKDDILLSELTLFMQKSHNDENIKFLQSVKTLNNNINKYCKNYNNDNKNDDDIDEKAKENTKNQINLQIISIYNTYIMANSQNQVNLSYDCFIHTMAKRDELFNLNMDQKLNIFVFAVEEIEHLMLSVLCRFYSTPSFKQIAAQRNIDNDYQSDSDSSPTSPPIVIGASHSTVASFEFDDYGDDCMIVYAK